MPDKQLLAQAYHTIMAGFVRSGRAPHYTELAATIGLAPAQGLQVQGDLIAEGMAVGAYLWAQEGTDYIAAAAPFSSIPTQNRISVGGRSRWYSV